MNLDHSSIASAPRLAGNSVPLVAPSGRSWSSKKASRAQLQQSQSFSRQRSAQLTVQPSEQLSTQGSGQDGDHHPEQPAGPAGQHRERVGPEIAVPSFAHTQLGAPYEPPLAPGQEDWDLHTPASGPDEQDKNTPDAWVPRNSAMIRLTGKHPLNCEPPMANLMKYGFITPVGLRYVRNHGITPRIEWQSHRITIGGLVDKPLTLSMDELLKVSEWVTVPVTTACSGNRRKEINMIKKSKGYDWGSAATATAYWTGVRLRDVLLKAGIKSPEEGALHVHMIGPKDEVAAGDKRYGTSIKYHKAMSPEDDVLLAFKQNDRWLTPDHGFPVRVIIPGFISGRMVKWLTEIIVTDVESTSHYHMHDNRVIPPEIDTDKRAEEEGYLTNPDFVVNNLNINSAIARPWHDEVVPLARDMTYTVKGYAYAGSGKKIVRVEVSLDDCKTWRQANIRRFDKPNRYGKYWCWVLWDMDIRNFEFLEAKELAVRAWDEDMNTQPKEITWNLIGMMNNCIYRIRILPGHMEDGTIGLRFQHPVSVATTTDKKKDVRLGWREEEHIKQQAIDAALKGETAPAPAPATPQRTSENGQKGGGEKVFTAEEVAKHTSEKDCWIIYNGGVYDPTPFLQEHPGGAQAILGVAGGDATDEFNSIHDDQAKQMLKGYYIGRLAAPGEAGSDGSDGKAEGAEADGAKQQGEGEQNGRSQASAHHEAGKEQGREQGKVWDKRDEQQEGDAGAAPEKEDAADGAVSAGQDGEQLVVLQPNAKVELKLAEKIQVTHNTRIFRFALPSPQHKLGLPCGRHVFSYATINGESVVRPYTPISSDDDLGHMDLMVKVYFPGPDNHPPGGKMSQYLDGLNIGDTVAFKGPLGQFTYEGRGSYQYKKWRGVAKHLSMVAGGTGITPIYSVMKGVLKDPEDKTTMSLIFANVTEQDILMREELDDLAKKHSDRLRVYHVLSKAPEGWQQGSGHVTNDIMREHLFPAGEDTLGLMCGPPGLMQHVCVPGFKALQYAEERTVAF